MAHQIYLTVIVTIIAIVSVSGDAGDPLWNRQPTSSKTAANWTLNYVRQSGYPIETHYVTTSDGYILKLYRIPSKPGGAQGGPPVLLHHGFVGCSADWVVLGPGKALGFLLADEGYDVWLANSRGSTESKLHTKLESKDRAFWDFSWHEIGSVDIPAEIDYILRVTGKPSLSYVGFSMGTTAFWVTASTKPEYLSKVTSVIALGPVAYMKHVQGPLLKYLAPLVANAEWIVRKIGSGELLPSTDFMAWAAKTFCANDALTQKLCSNILFLLYGFKNPTINGTTLARIFEFTPAGASTKQLLHYAQLVNKGSVFRWYDYGFVGNLVRYGKASPPDYDLAAVKVPVHIFMSNNDWFASNSDVTRLITRLPDPQIIKVVKRDSFNHFDFVYADDAHSLVYRDVLKILEAAH